ncbi:DUF4287 domain-containing protein (plasmid) [Coraliomargarita sp. W4R53]
MSFQAYLDNIEDKTGITPREFVALATTKGFGPGTKAGEIISWLAEDYSLGRGHAMALVHVITKGPKIDAKHVGTGTTHADASAELWLDGKATNPANGAGHSPVD